MSSLIENQNKITAWEEKIRVLESQLQVGGISEAKEIAIRSQIAGAEQVLAGLIAERRIYLEQQASAGTLANADFEHAVLSSLILSIKVKRKSCTGSGVAISNRRALTALHGMVPLNTPVTIRTRNGTKISGRVEFERFERGIVDVAVIVLDPPSVFNHFMPYSDQPVRLAQPIAVIGLKYASVDDSVDTYARMSSVESIEERSENSALFHAQYYNFDGCSGTGVVTTTVGNVLRVVGVHVASHDDTTLGGPKGKKKRTYSDLEASVASAIHGHTAYSLVCDIARVPDLLVLLSG